MMPLSLKIFLTVCVVLFLGYVIREAKHSKLTIGSTLIWIVLGLGIEFCVFAVDELERVAWFVGVKTVSNLLFFLGFVFLLFVCFNMTKKMADDDRKIRNLTQEVAILKKRLENGKEK